MPLEAQDDFTDPDGDINVPEDDLADEDNDVEFGGDVDYRDDVQGNTQVVLVPVFHCG